MGTRMQQKRGTAAQWAAANPILAQGEIGFAFDTGVVKLGDGVRPWNELTSAYVRRAGGDVIEASAPGVVPLAVRAAVGQTANLFEALDNAGTPIAHIDHAGNWHQDGLKLASESFVTEGFVDKSLFVADGDLIVGVSAGAAERVAKGAEGSSLSIEGGEVSWVIKSSGLNIYGNGSDGDVTIVGTVTLTRDMYYRNLTVPAGTTLKTNGFRVFVSQVATVNGIMDNSGVAGLAGSTTGSAASAAPGSAGGSTNTLGGGGNGGAAIPSSTAAAVGAGKSVTTALGGSGGTGGNGNETADGTGAARIGGVAGIATPPSATEGGMTGLSHALFATLGAFIGSIGAVSYKGGAGGGGGAQNGATAGGASDESAGGGGGGGGVVGLFAPTVQGVGSIRSNGGNGGKATVTPTTGGRPAGGGGGGGGGAILVVSTSPVPGTITYAVNAGVGGAGAGPGSTAGTDGVVGNIFLVRG